MKQVRHGAFETNSSSTHTICIDKQEPRIPKNHTINFKLGEYGWEWETVDDTASYLYTAILECGGPKSYHFGRLETILDHYEIGYNYENPVHNRCWYIDHGDELTDFLNMILNDGDLLMRFLFGESYVDTGNDNEDYCGDPHNDFEHYDYFKK